MDLSVLFDPNADPKAKQRAQRLLNTPQLCERLIIGVAVFQGNDYKSGFVVKNRVIH